MKIWRGEGFVASQTIHKVTYSSHSQVARVLLERERKVITPRLMRTEAVLVVRYIPLRIQLRGELHLRDRRRRGSSLLLDEAHGSWAENGGQVPVAASAAAAGGGVRGFRSLVGALRLLVARQPAAMADDWRPTRDGVALPGRRELEAFRALLEARVGV